MGSKVNPIIFRLYITREPDSDWYGSSLVYPIKFQSDLLIKRFIKNTLYRRGYLIAKSAIQTYLLHTKIYVQVHPLYPSRKKPLKKRNKYFYKYLRLKEGEGTPLMHLKKKRFYRQNLALFVHIPSGWSVDIAIENEKARLQTIIDSKITDETERIRLKSLLETPGIRLQTFMETTELAEIQEIDIIKEVIKIPKVPKEAKFIARWDKIRMMCYKILPLLERSARRTYHLQFEHILAFPKFRHLRALSNHREVRRFKRGRYRGYLMNCLFVFNSALAFNNADLIAHFIAKGLRKFRKGKDYFKFIKKILQLVAHSRKMRHDQQFLGLRVLINGRVFGQRRSWRKWIKYGRIETAQFKLIHIHFCATHAINIYGICGVKVWICRSRPAENPPPPLHCPTFRALLNLIHKNKWQILRSAGYIKHHIVNQFPFFIFRKKFPNDPTFSEFMVFQQGQDRVFHVKRQFMGMFFKSEKKYWWFTPSYNKRESEAHRRWLVYMDNNLYTDLDLEPITINIRGHETYYIYKQEKTSDVFMIFQYKQLKPIFVNSKHLVDFFTSKNSMKNFRPSLIQEKTKKSQIPPTEEQILAKKKADTLTPEDLRRITRAILRPLITDFVQTTYNNKTTNILRWILIYLKYYASDKEKKAYRNLNDHVNKMHKKRIKAKFNVDCKNRKRKLLSKQFLIKFSSSKTQNNHVKTKTN